MTYRRVDEQFLFPRPNVAVANVNDTGEALLFRSLLEHLGASVTLHQPGTPGDFLLILAQTDPPPYLIICAHGGPDGFEFGEYGEGIDTSMLQGTALPATAINANAQLPGSVIISTACLGGTPEMARAMLSGGAAAYLAADDYPNGADTGLFILTLFHSLLKRRQPLKVALERARQADPELQMFTLFT